MYGTSTLTIKGQVTIPQDMRLMLGIQSGDQVFFEANYHEKTLKLNKATKVVDKLYGSLKSLVPYSGRKQERAAAMAYVAKRHILK